MSEKAVSWAIGGLAIAAPLIVGGAHPTTQVVLSLAALLLVAASLLRREGGLRPVLFAWPMLVAVAFTAFQLLPLPSFVVHALSPGAWELREQTGGGFFLPLTVDVPATWLALGRGLACLGLFLLVAIHARSRHCAGPILVSIAIAGVAVAAITLIQRAVGAQSILGVYQPRSMPGSGFFVTFVNGNHAASLETLAALVLLGMAFGAEGGKRLLCLGSALLCASVLFYTGSRAGAVGFGVGLLLLLSVALVRRLGRATGLITAAAIVAVVAGATLWAADGLRSRLVPANGDALYENQKVRGWKDGAAVALAYRWVGVGRGAFEAPAAAFREDDEQVRLVYPENLLLESASEWGIPLTIALLILIGSAVKKLVPGLRRRELSVIGALSGVVAVLIHDQADFGLEMAGVAFPTVIALGVVVARAERRLDRHQKEPRKRWPIRPVAVGLAAWALAIVGAAWAVPHTLDSDTEKVAAALKAKAPELAERTASAIARHPGDDYFELVAAEDALRHRDPSALKHLNRALRLHPANWQAHYLAARTLLSLHRRGQAALEYRSAIERGLQPPLDEMVKLLGSEIVDAWPQRPDDLVRLAHALAARRLALDADEASQRAVALAAAPPLYLLRRVEVAMEAGDGRTLVPAAQALLDSQPDPDAAAAAIRALAQSTDVKATEDALDRMMKLHPDSTMLVLLGAQLRFDRGDLPGARALLKHSGDGSYSLHERQRAEELLAKIADKEGDVDGAIVARARARMIGHKLNDTSAMP